MLVPIKVLDIEVTQPITDIAELEIYQKVWGLIRFKGIPLGFVTIPITNGVCTAAQIQSHLLEHQAFELTQAIISNALSSGRSFAELRELDVSEWIPLSDPDHDQVQANPVVTVAVCSRNRAADLERCLAALLQLNYDNLDLLVIDNAPRDTTTQEVVEQYPSVRYRCEPRPGLDWARNRAIVEAKGEILAFTDDDVIVDAGWVRALVETFAANPGVMAITGLVVPYELETEAQALFELYGGFSRGFKQHWYQVAQGQPVPWTLLGTGQCGTGANMAFRRTVFNTIGLFDPALDVGTATNGGGDLEMFFRILRAGYPLVYEPRALVRHRHRRTYAELKRQIQFNGSLFAYGLSAVLSYPDQWIPLCLLSVWWFLKWVGYSWILSLFHPTRLPRELIRSEWVGALQSIPNYVKARRQHHTIEQNFGPFSNELLPSKYRPSQDPDSTVPEAIAVRQVELSQPLGPLLNLAGYHCVRVFITLDDQAVGEVDIPNYGHAISRDRLSQSIAQKVGLHLCEHLWSLSGEMCWSQCLQALFNHHPPHHRRLDPPPPEVSVSVVVATYDRPEDLRHCLTALKAQRTQRQVEIVVVDNHPASGLTPPIVTEFEDIKLVQESRQGLAYARNAGIVASTGSIIVATDDDVTHPSTWLEQLVTPFSRPDVMIVTGHVLPLQLDTLSQQAFETYGGLGRGYHSFEADGSWYELFPHKPSPTWQLGATANAAFRSTIFTDPRIGLMAEALGPGMPSGVGEDTYLFYKVLKADYTLVYDPRAYVWHKHRRDPGALRRQLYGYSKGHVSYNLTTWLQDGDWRGLAQVLIGLPKAHLYRIVERLQGRSSYPLSLIGVEILGNLAGPWSLWQSHRRVRQEGRSGPYLPVEDRSAQDPTMPDVEVPELQSVTLTPVSHLKQDP